MYVDDDVSEVELPPEAVENATPHLETEPGTAELPECDVVMKGGITSGVVYPGALRVVGERYRIRGIGGASAGAIGAAVGAAAEHNRVGGGFERLAEIPEELGGGALAKLFVPSKATGPLLRLLLAATGNVGGSPSPENVGGTRRTGTGRQVRAVVRALLRGFPLRALIGAAPGLSVLGIGLWQDGGAAWVLVPTGAVLALGGMAVALASGVYRTMTKAVPANLFGICTGHGESRREHGFTDWLADLIDDVAGLDDAARPLRFGQLWSGTNNPPDRADPHGDSTLADRRVDLRMITTCLSLGRPYEMPWDARSFFFSETEWRRLFPGYVIDALLDAQEITEPSTAQEKKWRREEQDAARLGLHRLPDAANLPVIVATRLSLSFPLLISAVPLWTADYRRSAAAEADDAAGATQEEHPTRFRKVWFTDGGFCSNFPIHLFDAALPSRPTFAINLGRFDDDHEVDPDDEMANVRWAKNNREGISTPYTEIPATGLPAISAFASAAINTSRNWQDNVQLNQPGARDRIVRVLHTKREGGLNLHMHGTTIGKLSRRGAAAATAITDQFREVRYRPSGSPPATGWENHQWVRYRALLGALPQWLRSWSYGRRVFSVDPAQPPSYKLSSAGGELASDLTDHLDQAAVTVAKCPSGVVERLTEEPRPTAVIRRVPEL